MEFIRFGGLSLVNQKGYDPSMPTFHCPPTRKGIYAFNLKTVEPFLLGTEEYSRNKLCYVKDKDGKPVAYTPENYEEYCVSTSRIVDIDGKVLRWEKDRNFYKNFASKKKGDKIYYAKPINPKRFFYSGEIWHHLEEFTKNSDILLRKGSWILTDISTYEKAFSKQSIHHRLEHTITKGNINEPWRAGITNCCSKDHLEVFISNKV